MAFTTQGQTEFAKVTSENVGKQLAIVLDGEMKSAPRINQAIEGDAVIEGIDTLAGSSGYCPGSSNRRSSRKPGNAGSADNWANTRARFTKAKYPCRNYWSCAYCYFYGGHV